MKIVVTGASGFVGRLVIPQLLDRGHDVLAVGRNPSHLRQLFPKIESCAYQDMPKAAYRADILVHLAVANNNSGLSQRAMHEVNVDFTIDVAKAARSADIPVFVNVSSIHALDGSNHHAYAATKREAAKQLGQLTEIKIATLFLPLVYGDQWSGSLAWLNRLPTWLARAVFRPLAAIKPAVHVKSVAQWISADAARLAGSDEICLADNQANNSYYSVARRLIDLTFAFAVLLFFWWLLLLVWVLVRLTSRGPGIFSQERVGRAGHSFTCYKFRTMQLGTKQAGTHEVGASSITRLGHSLRKTKIDELPQVWNIVRNEMSLIGPRPCLPSQKALIAARQRRGVMDMKPGLSGLAQINGIDMRSPDRLARWDARYRGMQSLMLDTKIALATLLIR